MDTLFLYNTKTLKEKFKTKVFAGDNHITKINVQIPDNIGGYQKKDCEFNLRAIIPEGNMSYIINPNEPYFYITNDITEKAQTVKLMMIITHAGNAIGRTNTVDLQVREPAEAPDPPLTPREQFDERIAELENENEGLEREVAEKDETITQQTERITELNGEVTELTNENTRLENLTDTQRETIQNMLDNPPQPKLYTPPEPIIPESETRVYTPPQNYDGFASFTVTGTSYMNIDLQKWVSPSPDDEPFEMIFEKAVRSYIANGQIKMIKATILTATSIGNNAFQGCTILTEVNLPDSLTSIGNNAFRGCTSLTEVNLPDSLTSIGGEAFRDCTSLTGLTLPDSLTSIGNNAFQGCTILTEVNLPDSLTSIGNNAFRGCTSLTEVNLPDSLTSIGGEAFRDCTSLTGLTLPDSLTSIGNGAFQSCTSLTEVNLPDSLTSIGAYAFQSCSSLANLTLAQGFNCNGLNVSSSTRFTAETIVACLEALADRTGQTAYTITFGSTNLNKLTAEQRAIATNKNWNLA